MTSSTPNEVPPEIEILWLIVYPSLVDMYCDGQRLFPIKLVVQLN